MCIKTKHRTSPYGKQYGDLHRPFRINKKKNVALPHMWLHNQSHYNDAHDHLLYHSSTAAGVGAVTNRWVRTVLMQVPIQCIGTYNSIAPTHRIMSRALAKGGLTHVCDTRHKTSHQPFMDP